MFVVGASFYSFIHRLTVMDRAMVWVCEGPEGGWVEDVLRSQSHEVEDVFRS